MGGQSSRVPADLSDLPAFQNLSEPAQNYFQLTSDGLLAAGSCVCAMSQKWDSSVMSYLTPQEKDEFNKWMTKKVEIVNAVDKFVRAEKVRYERVVREVKVGMTLGELMRNNNITDQAGQITNLISDITATRQGFISFNAQLKESCRIDGRADAECWKNFKSYFQASSVFVVACLIIGKVICHLIPGWQFAAVAEDVLQVSALLAAVFSLAAYSLSKDELARGENYLKNIEANLQKLKISVQELDSQSGQINDQMAVDEMKALIGTIVHRCEGILHVCEQC